jgi:hypothetical protein
MADKRLLTLHESSTLPRELFDAFTQKARAAGFGQTAAVVRLMRRYLARGFDDGQPGLAQATPNAPITDDAERHRLRSELGQLERLLTNPRPGDDLTRLRERIAELRQQLN